VVNLTSKNHKILLKWRIPFKPARFCTINQYLFSLKGEKRLGRQTYLTKVRLEALINSLSSYKIVTAEV